MPSRTELNPQYSGRSPNTSRRRSRSPTSPSGAAGEPGPRSSPRCAYSYRSYVNVLSSPVPPTRGNNKGKRRQNQPRPIASATSSPLQTSVAGPSSQCVVDYSIPSRPRIRHVPSSYGMGDWLGLSAAAPRSTSRASNRSVHSSHSAAPRSRSRIGARDGDGHVAMARSPSQIDAAAPITISNDSMNDSMEPPPPYMPPSPPRAPKPVVTSSFTSQLPVPDIMLSASDGSDSQSSSPGSSSDE